jgi:antitoxin ParD1/3/4
MSTLNISLPAVMKAFVEMQVRSGQYSSASDYVRTLIRADQQQRAETMFAAKLLDSVPSDAVAGVTPEVWAWLQTRLRHLSPAGHETRG